MNALMIALARQTGGHKKEPPRRIDTFDAKLGFQTGRTKESHEQTGFESAIAVASFQRRGNGDGPIRLNLITNIVADPAKGFLGVLDLEIS